MTGYSPPTREELQEYEEQEIARNRKRKIDATVRKLYPQVISEEHSLKRKPTKRATLEKSKQEPIKKEKRKRKIKVSDQIQNAIYSKMKFVVHCRTKKVMIMVKETFLCLPIFTTHPHQLY